MTPETANAPEQPPQTTVVTAPQFQFNRFAVKRISFQEVALVPPETEAPKDTDQMSLGLQVSVDDSGTLAQIGLQLHLTSDPRVKPYVIDVDVVGNFAIANGTRAQLEEFCKLAGPTILFPYIRQVVHQVTVDGSYGVLRLNPVNLQAAIKPDGWEAVQPATSATSE